MYMWPDCVTLDCVTTDIVLTEKITAALKVNDHVIECFFSHPELNESVAYESQASFATVVELGDVAKDIEPTLDNENNKLDIVWRDPIYKVGLKPKRIRKYRGILDYKVETCLHSYISACILECRSGRIADTGESEQGSEDDYVEDPEYAQEDDGILIDEQAENHLLRKGRKHVEIDVEDEDMEDEGDENNGIQLNKRNKRFKKEKFRELLDFRAKTDMGKAIFHLGLSFVSRKLFKQEIREYTLCEGNDIFFKKNDPHRVRAQCKGVNCPWMCYASKIDDSPTFVIKSYEKEHKCCRTNSNRFATAQWLSQKYREEFKVNEN
ncbi:hypothetical protein F8388_018372 [Cannabis sativa]|uniref:Transposase MuDR plant domain-containing protein n=1 Tax=Cannabis sativa TaxID=3483 RepID=A0A7J6HG52_CANSA|nr:hypothetical protein F8388_018372 [Cannabis sativa]